MRRTGSDRLAMYIDTVQRTSRVMTERIANEAVRWGMSRKRARGTIGEILDRAPAAMAAAREETDGVQEEMIATIERQLSQLVRAA
jgi:hypothetical protein